MEGVVKMRKLHIQQFLELTDTLASACRELKTQRDEDFFNLCAEIQEFVSQMFAYAENMMGEDTVISQLLRELYELLYFASQGQAQIKQILHTVQKLGREALCLKPDKIEVAFFCYKASMSDSLESVYFAAKNDPACDAYFIPIPYFDKNPDGSFGQMHFEGTGYYSDQYELTDWQKYDVENRRPDVIFIMNPYDEQNRVTSVHPAFYSSRLKNHTDMLVYIEYGLLYWVYKDSFAPEAFEDYKKNGIITPAYIHCDYAISYSEEVAQAGRQLFAAHPEIAELYGITQQKAKEKFIPLGSPKFDKILNIEKEDCFLPLEWSEKIQGKKVVLYNTGLTEFLKSSKQQLEIQKEYAAKDSWYFAKVRSIIEAFKDSEEAVLWWRPHPLFEATLRSMRPEFLREYLKIVEEFKDIDEGIFDITEDLHRAIVYSDAMISDESSLLLLYAITGKPFYIPAISNALPNPTVHDGPAFFYPLQVRLDKMRVAKGANIWNGNYCIWWPVFSEEDAVYNIRFENFPKRFLRYVLKKDQYEDREEYAMLQKKMVTDFVINADGTAGQKIYEFVRQKTIC